MKLKRIVTTLMLVSSVTASATDFELARCERVNGINTRSLSTEENTKFRKWIFKCNPLFALEAEKDGYAIVSGTKYRLYPVFGKAEVIEDATTETGYRVIYSNPKNYIPPFDQILANPDTTACNIPEDYIIAGWCRESCYTPDQKLAFVEGDVEILAAKEFKLNNIITLSPEATLESVQNNDEVFKVSQLFAYVVSPKVKEHIVYDFVMKSGGKLTVTDNHPLLNGAGIMKVAADFSLGESLMLENGKADEIVSAESRTYIGKVYNVEVDSTDKMENIVVAQGYLSGASRYQNELTKLLNRQTLRLNAIPDMFVKD